VGSRAYERAGIRVLIADEDLAFAQTMRALLQSQSGVEVVGVARDGPTVVDLAGELEPDVILIDLPLPVMDGFEATRRIRETELATTIILMTGTAELPEVDDVGGSGANAFVRKADAHTSLPGIVREIARLSPSSTPR
jgi:CheY-like chemotaxis protein